MGLEILTWRFWMKSILNQSIYFSSMCFPMSVTAVYTNAFLLVQMMNVAL